MWLGGTPVCEQEPFFIRACSDQIPLGGIFISHKFLELTATENIESKSIFEPF